MGGILHIESLLKLYIIFAFAVILVYAIVRKKLIILYSVGLGTIITLATYLYQVKPFIMDVSIIYHGFPAYWLQEAYGWGGPPYRSYIQWGELLLDIVFWSIIGFIGIAVYSRAKKLKNKSKRQNEKTNIFSHRAGAGVKHDHGFQPCLR